MAQMNTDVRAIPTIGIALIFEALRAVQMAKKSVFICAICGPLPYEEGRFAAVQMQAIRALSVINFFLLERELFSFPTRQIYLCTESGTLFE